MNRKKLLLAATVAAAAFPAAAQLTLYGREGFQGRAVTIERGEDNLVRRGFNDRASSAIVSAGRYEVCEDNGFQGRCVVLRPGQYPSLDAMGIGKAVSSARPVGRRDVVEERRFAPPPPVAYDYRRRRDERLFDAEVVDVRAVYGRSGDRCWVERERVASGRNEPNVGGAIVGGIIGGILGHQIGSGRGNDAATVAGALGGAALGANVDNNTYTRGVRHCEPGRANAQPDYWDVTYRFRGRDYYVQMTTPPGRTVLVNARGEPRA